MKLQIPGFSLVSFNKELKSNIVVRIINEYVFWFSIHGYSNMPFASHIYLTLHNTLNSISFNNWSLFKEIWFWNGFLLLHSYKFIDIFSKLWNLLRLQKVDTRGIYLWILEFIYITRHYFSIWQWIINVKRNFHRIKQLLR